MANATIIEFPVIMLKNFRLLVFFSIAISNNVLLAEENTIFESSGYQATITRDKWGVPHIFGKRDEDAAFGLAYAHADDDIKNIAENMVLYRAQSALEQGFQGAAADYLIKALDFDSLIKENYESDLSLEVRKVIEGYAAGLNYWNEVNDDNKYKSIFPVSSKDIVTGFVIQNLLFSGVVSEIQILQEGRTKFNQENPSQSHLLRQYQNILGSNAIAIGPNKTDDGSTRLIINSHQPLEGPVAWYEAHIRSDEGWNMMGGTFPGAPFIFVGFNENLGWGLTVNKPDLTDIYQLEINPQNKDQYLLDGQWTNFKKKKVALPIKLFGPIRWTFKREVKESLHGLVIENDHGVFAVRFTGMNEIRQVEQWYRMNKSSNKDQWLSAMNIRAIASFNAIFADKDKNILFLHNGAIPKRKKNIDWSGKIDGTDSKLIWSELEPFDSLPLIINPESGWLVSTNQDPFKVTSVESNLKRDDYSHTLGLQTRMTNRAYRALEMLEDKGKISKDDLLKIKFDNQYSKHSRSYKYIEPIFNMQFDSKILKDAQKVLLNWDLRTDFNNRGAALGVCILSHEWLAEQESRKPPEIMPIFQECANELNKNFNRLDPKWSEVNFLIRGKNKIPVQGGPDTMRAIYGETQKDSTLKAVAGDGLIAYVEWDINGDLSTESIHQYGSATQDEESMHYSDQINLFSEERLKMTFFELGQLKINTSSRSEIPLNVQ